MIRFSYRQLVIGLVVFGVISLAGAQEQTASNPSAPAQSGNEEATAVSEQRAPAPAFLSGGAGSTDFAPELERSNYLRGGVTVGGTYDDNASSSATNRIDDISYSVMPNITFDITRSRVRWNLAYAGGFIANQRLSERNQGSHDLSAALALKLSPHVNLHLSDSFLATTGFLQQFQNSLGTPVTGPVNQPNQTVITPLSKMLNNTGAADLSYQFGANDMIGGGGTFYDSHFRDTPTGSSSLLDTSSRVGDIFYTHRFGNRNWTGYTYRFQQLTFSPGANRTRTHSLLVSDTITLSPRMTLSFYAGPEYTELDSQVVTIVIAPPLISLATIDTSEHRWSVSGGASFGLQGVRNSLRFDVTRKVSDGGGLLGAVQLTSVGGAFRHQLLPKTAMNLRASYGNNEALGVASVGTPTLKSATGGVGLEQRLSTNLALSLEYGRDFQTGGLVSTTGDINHNRAMISLSYQFTRPLGR